MADKNKTTYVMNI